MQPDCTTFTHTCRTTTLRQQVAILDRMAQERLSAAGYDIDDVTYSALLAGLLALQRELHSEERTDALLTRSQAILEGAQ